MAFLRRKTACKVWRVHDVKTCFRKGLYIFFRSVIVFNDDVTEGGRAVKTGVFVWCSVMAGRFKNDDDVRNRRPVSVSQLPPPPRVVRKRRSAGRRSERAGRAAGRVHETSIGRAGRPAGRPVACRRRAYATRVITSLAPSVAERRRRFTSGGRPGAPGSYTTRNGCNALCRVAVPPLRYGFPSATGRTAKSFVPVTHSNI